MHPEPQTRYEIASCNDFYIHRLRSRRRLTFSSVLVDGRLVSLDPLDRYARLVSIVGVDIGITACIFVDCPPRAHGTSVPSRPERSTRYPRPVLRVCRFLSGRRSKWVVAGAWLLLIVGFAGFGSKLPDKTNDEIVLPASSDSAQLQRLLAQRFPGGEQRIALLVYHRAGGLTAADRTGDPRRRAEGRPGEGRRGRSPAVRHRVAVPARQPRRRGDDRPAQRRGPVPAAADDRRAARHPSLAAAGSRCT